MATWNFDTSHSTVSFRARHLMFAKVRGHFRSWQGTLQADEGSFAGASMQVSVDIGSIDTGVADRDGHLKSADFFDAASYPTMKFVSIGVKQQGDALEVLGELTIRDTTLPVTLTTTFQGAATDPWGNRRLAFAAHTKVSRKAFGLQWNQLMETGGAVVGDEIEIELDVQAVRVAG